jgi:pimeloyl-ACP methyl ester carboxylesterase
MSEMNLPWLPDAAVVALPGRGEILVRRHVHPDASAPTVLLLHGWTANADTQFFTAYRRLAESCSFVTVDHRGHGRGLRPAGEFGLEDCADDAAAVLRHLGVGPVVTVGYSMGGPISMLLRRRHPDLVAGMVLAATAMEWRSTLRDRIRWWLGRLASPIVRHTVTPRTTERVVSRFISDDHVLAPHRSWLVGEIRRNDPWLVAGAGRALSRFDARSFAADLAVPAATVLTTADRLVRPRKQRRLAEVTGSEVIELVADHFAPLTHPAEFASVTATAVDSVVRRIRDGSRSSR